MVAVCVYYYHSEAFRAGQSQCVMIVYMVTYVGFPRSDAQSQTKAEYLCTGVHLFILGSIKIDVITLTLSVFASCWALNDNRM